MLNTGSYSFGAKPLQTESHRGSPVVKNAAGFTYRDRLLEISSVVDQLHAAGLTDLGPKWVSDQIDRGKLRAVVVARKWRGPETAVRRMINGFLDQALGKIK